MIAVDTNILVYGHRSDAPFHERACTTLRDLVEGERSWCIPWPCAHEFLAKVTHPRIFKTPTPLPRALAQLAEWLRSPRGQTLAEPEGYFDVLSHVLVSSRVTGARVHDARIAALCLAHGVDELWTADRDFNRFANLRVRNPLSTEV